MAEIRPDKIMKPQILTAENFQPTIAAGPQPVLVDFYADWCGPCKMLAPVLDELAAEQAGRAVVAKLDIDAAPEIAARFGITSIPTLIVFQNGQPQRTLRGVQSKAALAAALAFAGQN